MRRGGPEGPPLRVGAVTGFRGSAWHVRTLATKVRGAYGAAVFALAAVTFAASGVTLLAWRASRLDASRCPPPGDTPDAAVRADLGGWSNPDYCIYTVEGSTVEQLPAR